MGNLRFALFALFITSGEARTKVNGNSLRKKTPEARIDTSSRRNLHQSQIEYDFGPNECLICDDVQNYKEPEMLIMKFTGNFGNVSEYMNEDDSTCSTINVQEDVFTSEADDGKFYSILVAGYGKFLDVQVGDIFQFPPGEGEFTEFRFTAGNDDDVYVSCMVRTSCSAPLVAGDNHGPFQLLDKGSCLKVPECLICDSIHHYKQPEMLLLEFTGDFGAMSEFMNNDDSTCNTVNAEDIYTSGDDDGRVYSVMVAGYGHYLDIQAGDTFQFPTGLSAWTEFRFAADENHDEYVSCIIKTSCSAPLAVGDNHGPFKFLDNGICSNHQCLQATLREDENGSNVVDVEFDYENLRLTNRNFVSNCNPADSACDSDTGSVIDLAPLSSDWIGFYPCEQNKTQPFAFGAEPTIWTYTCYDEVCGNPIDFPAITNGSITFDDKTLPRFARRGTAFKPLKELEGCYAVLLNRINGYGTPSYYNLCLGNTIEFPGKDDESTV